MRRVLLLLLVAASLWGGAFHAARAASAQTVLPRVTSPTGQPAATQHPIVGAWRWDYDPAHPDTQIAYGIFHADGTYEEVSNGAGTAVGVWAATGERSVAVTYIAQDVAGDPSDPGERTVRLRADVRPSGNVITATFAFVARTSHGTKLDHGGPFAAQGTRITVAPLSPLGPPRADFALGAADASAVTQAACATDPASGQVETTHDTAGDTGLDVRDARHG